MTDVYIVWYLLESSKEDFQKMRMFVFREKKEAKSFLEDMKGRYHIAQNHSGWFKRRVII